MLLHGCCCPTNCIIDSDDFNRADNADIGGKWTDSNSRITGNRLTQQALGASSAITVKQHTSEQMVVDVSVGFTSSSISLDLGIVAVNYLDSNNYLYIQIEVSSSAFSGTAVSTKFKFFRRSGGVSTQLGATRTIDATNGVVNHQARVCYDGTYLKAFGQQEKADRIVGGFRAGLLTSASAAVFFDSFRWYKWKPKCPNCNAKIICNGCITYPTSSLILDFGAGGLVDGSCSACDSVAGEYILGWTNYLHQCYLTTSPHCSWGYNSGFCSIAGTPYSICMSALLVLNGFSTGWDVVVGIVQGPPGLSGVLAFGTPYVAGYGGALATYGQCNQSPVTLSKTSENFLTGACTGALPASIELRLIT